jgi:drug/metabolite transporter (DMT)-like permease
VTPLLFALIGLAAVLHATWNALLKGSTDPLRLAARALGVTTLVTTPLAAVLWVAAGRPGLPLEAWELAILSAAAELVYFNFLSAAYRRGELSVVYPIARGTAPVVAVAIGLVVLHEGLRGWELVGVACLVAGIWAVSRPATAGRALVPALATGVMIAVYSAIDRVGVRLGPPLLYGWILWIFAAIILNAWVFARGLRGDWVAPKWSQALAVGVPMTAAYLLVLLALNVAPLAVVSPVRESAIVLVTGWGIWRLHERRGAAIRLAGAGAIVLGIALLALT